MDHLRIISWNVLAPELFMYFWRGSYGLDTSPNKEYYDAIQLQRINHIIEYVRAYDPHILCLQETTDNTYQYLGNLSMQHYVAQQCGYDVIANSFKQSGFKYDYPPQEQKQTFSVDSGVSTLVKRNSAVKFLAHTTQAEDFGPSKLFKSGIGSPFTVDLFQMYNHVFNIINIHIRMQYPHIYKSLVEVYDRVATKLTPIQFQNSIALGDFNAHSLLTAKELLKSPYYLNMFDKHGHELIDDHVFVGHNLRQFHIQVGYGSEVKLLEMNVNQPTAGPKYKTYGTNYNGSAYNENLVHSGELTTDHYPIVVDINWQKIDRSSHTV